MKRVTGGMVPAGVWKEIMTTASAKQPKSYYNVMSVSSDFSFSDLIGRLIGGGDDDNAAKPLEPKGGSAKPQPGGVNGTGKWQYND